MNLQAISLATRGILGGGVPLATGGYIVTISDFIYVPPVKTGGGSFISLGPYKQDNFALPKLITISVIMADGELHKKMFVVQSDLEVKAEDVVVTESEGGKIEISISSISVH